jgi:hypothetical protein
MLLNMRAWQAALAWRANEPEVDMKQRFSQRLRDRPFTDVTTLLWIAGLGRLIDDLAIENSSRVVSVCDYPSMDELFFFRDLNEFNTGIADTVYIHFSICI